MSLPIADFGAPPPVPQPMPGIPRQPVPTVVRTGTVTTPTGDRLVLIEVETPSGVQTYFFDRPTATQIANQILAQTSGLVVASAAQVPR